MTATLRSDFNEFLHAPIGEDASGIPLTMLSALARLDKDPWEEATELARLPLEPATQRLVAMLATVPNWRVPPGDATRIATLLIELLHRAAATPSITSEAPVRVEVAATSKEARLARYYLFALIFMIIAQCVTSIRHPQPMDTSIVPVLPN